MNKNLIPFKSTLLKNKLASVLQTLLKSRDSSSPQTKEALIAEAVKLVSTFYKQIDKPRFEPVKLFVGNRPDPVLFNKEISDIKDDLDILFAELENIEAIVLEQFNITATNTSRLNGQLKKISSKVADYSLYARLPSRDRLFFTDSFSDFSRIDINSPLLNSPQCEINQAEGIITLPVSLESSVTLILNQRPIINANSNGVSGNNEDLTALQLNNNLEALLDNNPDTWFEYERVELQDTGVPLVLDLTLNLGSFQIVNFLRVNPNNFGTKSQVNILNIDTSSDGKIFTSIKDDIPISGYLVQDEDNVFSLASSTSKFAGQGIFTFTPRVVKYIRLTFEQTTPYLINTVRGQQFRYAIGIRDIEIKRLAYQQKGELISRAYTVNSEIVKVALETSQSPLQDSELASITHQVSFDDGISWKEIRPLNNNGVLNSFNNIPEVLTLNLSVPGAITTSSPAVSVRYKAILERKDEGFTSGSTSFAENLFSTIEIHNAPRSQPWTITLKNSPVNGSILLVDPNFGSRGRSNNRYLIGTGSLSARHFNIPWELPFDAAKVFDDEWKLTSTPAFNLFVGGEQWFLRPDLSSSGPEDKHYSYTFTTVNNESEVVINVGNGTNGLAPPDGAPIEIGLTAERLYTSNLKTAKLKYPTSADKSSVRIVRTGDILPATSHLEKGTQIHKLNSNIIISTDYPIVFSDSTVFDLTKRRTFSNGMVAPQGELDQAGAWSIDTSTGRAYSYLPTNSTVQTSVSYFNRTDVELTDAQWNFVNADELNEEIEIVEDSWITKSQPAFTIASGINKIVLPDLALVKGTVKFNISDVLKSGITDPFIEEVDFSGNPNVPELSNVVKTEEIIPDLLSSGSDILTFTLQAPVSSDTNLSVSFSNNLIFIEEQTSLAAVTTEGDWYIERNTGSDYGKVYLFTGGESYTSPGTVVYYITNASQVKGGAYCVDYNNGIIYTQRTIPTTGITVSYDYSDYYINYNIARKINQEDWSIDLPSRTISLKDKEIQLKSRFSQANNLNALSQSVYQVSYKYIGSVRESIETLVNYFSPVLKDYNLQVITKEFL